MSTADKLNKLLETKQAIKQAIIDKGVDVSDDTVFAEYAAKINAIESGGGTLPIRVIGSGNLDEPFILTGNEFTDEEYENGIYFPLCTDYATVKYIDENGNESGHWIDTISECYIGLNDDGTKYIGFCGIYGSDVCFTIDENGVFTLDYYDEMVWDYELENYATKEELNNAIRNIEIPEVDLENYATKEELNDAISNIEISGGSECALKVIGSDNPDEPHIFTGDEFTDEEIENQYIPVLFRNVEIAGLDVSGLCDVRFLGRDLIYIYSPRLGFHEYFKDGDTGEWYESTGYYYATDFELEGVREELAGYATKKELNNALGDIESLLGNI